MSFYNKFYCYLLCFSVVSLLPMLPLHAHIGTADSADIAVNIAALNTSRIAINRTAMFVLGGWAVSNIAVGSVMIGRTSGSEHYVHQMNVFWNVVNLAIAGAGLYSAFTEMPAASLYDVVDKQYSIETVLLLNAGLDVAYIAAGAWMLEHAKTDVAQRTERSDLWKGYGTSLLVQGAFLLLFDATVYAIHHSTHQPLIRNLLDHARLGVSANGGVQLGLTLRL